jgi:hypothetical protein
MTEGQNTGNPFFDAWMTAQRRFLQTNPLAATIASDGLSEAVARAERDWKLCQSQAENWFKVSGRWLAPDPARPADESLGAETLRRLFDPSRFLYAGSDEINRAIQRLVEGPELADIGTLERQVLTATREWISLREAGAAYRAVTAGAWSRAFAEFSRQCSADPALLGKGPRAVLDLWLRIANEELIRTQRTEAVLSAQRNLLSAGVAYRLKERALVEVWCEAHSIPTRTEIDDLHRTVHELRGQVRKLSARLNATE